MDGDADICRRQGRRIIDAVADHHHRMSFGFGVTDKGGFILWQHLCKAAVHPHLRRNGAGGAVTVAGHHDGLGNAQLPELMQHLCRLRAQGVCDADDPRQHPGSSQIQVGILGVQRIELCLFRCRDGAALVLKNEVGAANDHPRAAHPAGNAVRHDILHLGVHLLVGDAPLLGGADDSVCHGMGEMLFQTGSKLQYLLLPAAGEGHHLHHLRGGVGEGAGLIEHDGVRLCQRFQILATLYGDVVFPTLPHGREHRQRHGKLQRTGEVHHQNGDGAGDVAGKGVGSHRTGKAPRHQTVGQLQSPVLGTGLELFRFLDHRHDLIVAVGTALCLGHKNALALFHHCSCVDSGTGGLAYRHRLAGQGGLVHHGFALQHRAVQRDHIAGAHHYLVPCVDAGQRHQHLALRGAHPDLIHVQRHAAGKVIQALFPRPLLQQAAHRQQEHHRACGAVIAPQEGGCDAERIQHLYFQLAVQQAADALPDKGDGAPHRIRRRDGRRQEHLAEHPARHKADHLLLIFLIDLPAVVGGDQRLQFFVVKAVGRQQGGGVLPAAPVGQHHISGALVDGGFLDVVLPVQVGLQHICPVQGHAHSADVHPHPSLTFM